MNSFQNPDVITIQRLKADVFMLTRDRIKFMKEGSNDKYPFSAILDPRFYQGNINILEDAVRNKKKLWLIIEVRNVSTNSISLGFSASGKVLILSDAHYVNDADEIDADEIAVNPSKR